MLRDKALWLSAVVIAIAALFAATDGLAAPPTQCTTQDFVVNVDMQTANGITSYLYTLANAPGSSKNPNKFFVFVKGRQVDGQGLQGDLQGTIGGSTAGSYVLNGGTGAANCPPSGAWTFDKDDDGWCFTSVALGNVPKLTVSERFKPEEGNTTTIIGLASGTQSCGPILGPTTPAAPKFEGSPLVSTQARLTFENQCIYLATVDATTNIIVNVTTDPSSPAFGTDGSPCEVVVANCEQETGVLHCPPHEVGRPPLQTPGSKFCWSGNLKYHC